MVRRSGIVPGYIRLDDRGNISKIKVRHATITNAGTPTQNSNSVSKPHLPKW